MYRKPDSENPEYPFHNQVLTFWGKSAIVTGRDRKM